MLTQDTEASMMTHTLKQEVLMRLLSPSATATWLQPCLTVPSHLGTSSEGCDPLAYQAGGNTMAAQLPGAVVQL